jgi:His/Glu/Gln/Arg/opine family amino acid ABC transporter permease subunit
VAAALARISGSRVLRGIARAYVSIIRGTPLLVQLFIVFFGLPEIGIDLASWPAAILALSLNVGGYAAEIVRSAIMSVPKGQSEAASTIGMGYWQTMRRIILPQAARTAVPPLSNTLISLVKDTSLLSVVLVTELFREATYAASAAQIFMPLYAVAALYYWIVCALLAFGQDRVETRLDRFVAS